jgi:hypothetical protein
MVSTRFPLEVCGPNKTLKLKFIERLFNHIPDKIR